MNERFVAVSTDTRGLGYVVALLRRDVILMSRGGWKQMMNAIRWIKQFAKNSQQSLSRLMLI